VDQRETHGGRDSRRKPDPGRVRGVGRSGSREGGDEHLALKTDIDDAGALGPETREAGGKQGDRQPERRIEDRDEGRDVHVTPSRAAAAPERARRDGERVRRAPRRRG
jgi:hypothetical protein